MISQRIDVVGAIIPRIMVITVISTMDFLVSGFHIVLLTMHTLLLNIILFMIRIIIVCEKVILTSSTTPNAFENWRREGAKGWGDRRSVNGRREGAKGWSDRRSVNWRRDCWTDRR
jgi:hypothetical protein